VNMQDSLKIDWLLFFDMVFLVLASILVLNSFSPSLFPLYLVYILVGFFIFYIFARIDFDIFLLFSSHLYLVSIGLLIAPLIIGQVTRGAIRWIPVGTLSIQPSEVVRPFLLLFFAKYITAEELTPKRFIKVVIVLLIPLALIFVAPSLGVAILTGVGFLGVLLASKIEKKYLLASVLLFVLLAPVLWFILAPYQKQRILSFANPGLDPYGTGYNSIQSMISVGSGKLTGRGLGEGAQTQLAFLPERQSDFVFAATAEELGFMGAFLILAGLFLLLSRIILVIENASSPTGRSFAAGVFLVLFAETFIHIGMNMGIVPITGVPLPLISAGGSALLGTMMALSIAMRARRTF